MVPHHQTLTVLTASAGLEVIVLGKINWCHFQQLDQDSWHNNKRAIVCMCGKKVLHLFIIHCINNIIYVKKLPILNLYYDVLSIYISINIVSSM